MILDIILVVGAFFGMLFMLSGRRGTGCGILLMYPLLCGAVYAELKFNRGHENDSALMLLGFAFCVVAAFVSFGHTKKSWDAFNGRE